MVCSFTYLPRHIWFALHTTESCEFQWMDLSWRLTWDWGGGEGSTYYLQLNFNWGCCVKTSKHWPMEKVQVHYMAICPPQPFITLNLLDSNFLFWICKHHRIICFCDLTNIKWNNYQIYYIMQFKTWCSLEQSSGSIS